MKLTRMTRTAGWLAVASLLGAALITPAATFANGATYATVTDHEAFSEDANKGSYWGENCDKLDDTSGDSYVLEESYGLVVVKAGSGEFANTLFDNPTAGETVWADTNGNEAFDPDGQDGDKEISHIILCDPATTTTETTADETTTTTETTADETTTDETTADETTADETTTDETTTDETTTDETTTASTPSGRVLAEVGAPDPTLPSTDTASLSGTSSPAGSTWQLLLVAMAGLLATVLLLTPATVARKR